jgi:hypothetical protein
MKGLRALRFGAVLALCVACSSSGSKPSTDTAAPVPSAPAPAPVLPPAIAPVPPTGAVLAAASAHISHDAGVPPATVKIVFRTFPGRRGVVMWGGKRLGFVDRDAPLVVERPRDTGPLDVVVRVTGYLPVHTRAYTFSDSNIDVRITPLDKKDTLYGYKEPLPPDAGVPFPGEPTDIPE